MAVLHCSHSILVVYLDEDCHAEVDACFSKTQEEGPLYSYAYSGCLMEGFDWFELDVTGCVLSAGNTRPYH